MMQRRTRSFHKDTPARREASADLVACAFVSRIVITSSPIVGRKNGCVGLHQHRLPAIDPISAALRVSANSPFTIRSDRTCGNDNNHSNLRWPSRPPIRLSQRPCHRHAPRNPYRTRRWGQCATPAPAAGTRQFCGVCAAGTVASASCCWPDSRCPYWQRIRQRPPRRPVRPPALDSPRELGYSSHALTRHLLKIWCLELPWLAGAAGGPQGKKLTVLQGDGTWPGS